MRKTRNTVTEVAKMTKYDLLHQKASIKYNADLQSGDYADALHQLETMLRIAELEGRTQDYKSLNDLAELIRNRLCNGHGHQNVYP